jgi:hypothetical protein
MSDSGTPPPSFRPPQYGSVTINHRTVGPQSGNSSTSSSSSLRPVTNVSIRIEAAMVNFTPIAQRAVDLKSGMLSQLIDMRINSAISQHEQERKAFMRSISK